MHKEMKKKVELLSETELFDDQWYINKYMNDINVGRAAAVFHFISNGWRKMYDPSPYFSTQKYLDHYPDVKQAKVNPLIHYLTYGRKEGRSSFTTESEGDRSDEGIYHSYVKRGDSAISATNDLRTICFYLPQYHEIPENNQWWGHGFTEWSNVKVAEPQFSGHYQPHVPEGLGYYDLLDLNTQRQQIDLAKQYGIKGFCFYFYWFGGRRLLEQPLLNWLNNDDLDFPFCLCWANEGWTRRWDGLEQDVLIPQHHTPDDDIHFIEYVSCYMKDRRYIRIDGKAVLLVYRPTLFPDINATILRWRHWCEVNDVGPLYIILVNSFDCLDPYPSGGDATTEFPPTRFHPQRITDKKIMNAGFKGEVYSYKTLLNYDGTGPASGPPVFRCVVPGWDNTPRRKDKSHIFLGSSPCLYQKWIYRAAVDTLNRFPSQDERLLFINAWNEWGEGAHLEPDQRYGAAYIEATRTALLRASLHLPAAHKQGKRLAVVIHAYYPNVMPEVIKYLSYFRAYELKLFVSTSQDNAAAIDSVLESSGFCYYLAVFENRGRDILPFLKIMPQVISEGFELLLKIHTKRSLHLRNGDQWRRKLLSYLLMPAALQTVFRSFSQDPSLGIIGPSAYIYSVLDCMGNNTKSFTKLCSRLGYFTNDISGMHFFAGTMFFARTRALLPLLSLFLEDDDFETEEGQTDGTMAHAIERIIGVSCKAAGMKYSGI